MSSSTSAHIDVDVVIIVAAVFDVVVFGVVVIAVLGFDAEEEKLESAFEHRKFILPSVRRLWQTSPGYLALWLTLFLLPLNPFLRLSQITALRRESVGEA